MAKNDREWTSELRDARRRLIRLHNLEIDLLESIRRLLADDRTCLTSANTLELVHSHKGLEIELECLCCMKDLLHSFHVSSLEDLDMSTIDSLKLAVSESLGKAKFADLDNDVFFEILIDEVRNPSQLVKRIDDPSLRKSKHAQSDTFPSNFQDSKLSPQYFETFQGNLEYQLKIFRGRVGSGRITGDGKINLHNSINYEEDLPLPWVQYPPLYGCFPAFSKTESGEWFACLCQKEVLQKLARQRLKLDRLISSNLFSKEALTFRSIKWEDSICHRCLRILPGLGTFPHQPLSVAPDLGGQEPFGMDTPPRWGMYVQIAMYEAGLNSTDPRLLLRKEHVPWATNLGWVFKLENVPKSTRPLVDKVLEADAAYAELFDAFDKPKDSILDPEFLLVVRDRPRESRRELRRYIENQVREIFNVRPVGATGKSETALFQIIRDLFPNLLIERNIRPAWLRGLEIDIWIPEFKIAIEYQGEQHFQAIEHWGGAVKLAEQQRRDLLKRELCSANGIVLIEFLFNEKLSNQLVKSRLEHLIT